MPALKGVEVVDLTRVVVGPYCLYPMALMGAQVTKIERPGQGDPVRRSGAGSGQRFRKQAMASNFLSQNAKKRALTPNLKHDEGRAAFMKRVNIADMVIETFSQRREDRKSTRLNSSH